MILDRQPTICHTIPFNHAIRQKWDRNLETACKQKLWYLRWWRQFNVLTGVVQKANVMCCL